MSDDSDERNGTPIDVDPVLAHLVGNLESWDTAVPEGSSLHVNVTLSVRGTIITGEAIPERTYLRAHGERWRQTFARGVARELAERISNDLGQFAGDVAERQALDGERSTPTYIHLREAYFVSGGVIIPVLRPEVAPGLFRIPMARVDAFMLGAIIPATLEPGEP